MCSEHFACDLRSSVILKKRNEKFLLEKDINQCGLGEHITAVLCVFLNILCCIFVYSLLLFHGETKMNIIANCSALVRLYFSGRLVACISQCVASN